MLASSLAAISTNSDITTRFVYSALVSSDMGEFECRRFFLLSSSFGVTGIRSLASYALQVPETSSFTFCRAPAGPANGIKKISDLVQVLRSPARHSRASE